MSAVKWVSRDETTVGWRLDTLGTKESFDKCHDCRAFDESTQISPMHNSQLCQLVLGAARRARPALAFTERQTCVALPRPDSVICVYTCYRNVRVIRAIFLRVGIPTVCFLVERRARACPQTNVTPAGKQADSGVDGLGH